MKKIIVIETKKLKEMLDNVKNATSKDESRPVFKGILLEAEGTKLTMTACDGYKLFTSSSELIEGDRFEKIIPLFTIPKGAEAETKIEVEEDIISFDFGNVKYSYKTIKGEFIDYKKLLRRDSDFSIRFNNKPLTYNSSTIATPI